MTSKNLRSRSRRALRLLRLGAIVVVALYALYLVAANEFLSTSLFERVVNASDRTAIEVTYRRGWSWFPGRVHADDLRIRASDSKVEWLLTIDDVDFDVSLAGLLRRQFDVARVRGRGVALRARQKLDAQPESVEEIARLPPIPGFPAFSVRPSGPPSPEAWDDARWRLWTVRLEDVIAEDVREVWIDDGRFQGHARVRGRFRLEPLRAVDVGPAHVEIDEGRVTAGPSLLVAESVAGKADVTIDRFDPRTLEGRGLLRYLTVAADLRGTLADVGTLPLRVPPEVYLSGGADVGRLALDVRRGVISAGTRVDVVVPRALVARNGLVAKGRAHAVAGVEPRAGGDRWLGDVELGDVALSRADGGMLLRAPRLVVTTEARELDLARRPFSDTHATVDAPSITLDDATVANVYLPAEIAVLSGQAEAEARLEVSVAEGMASGSGRLRGSALDVRLAKMRAHGAFEMIGSIDGWRRDRIASARASVVVSDGVLSSERRPKVAFETLLADLRADDVDTEDPLRSLDATFEMRGGSVADVRLLEGWLSRAARTGGESRFELDGRVRVADHLARGTLHVHSGALRLHVGDLVVSGRVEARARVHDWDWEHGDLAVDEASVVIDRIRGRIGGGRDDALRADRLALAFSAAKVELVRPTLRGAEARVVLEGAEVRDARTFAGMFLPDDGPIRVLSGSMRASVDLAVSSSRGSARGGIALDVIEGAISIGETTFRGDVEGRIDARAFDPEAAALDVSGSRVVVRNAGVKGASGGDRRFGASAVAEDAAIVMSSGKRRNASGPAVDARVRMTCDDARPGLDLVLGGVVPKMLLGLGDRPELQADGRVRIGPQEVVVSGLTATAGDVAVRGSYALVGDARGEGAFVVERGPFSVGLGIHDGSVSPRFFNLAVWLASRERRLAQPR